MEAVSESNFFIPQALAGWSKSLSEKLYQITTYAISKFFYWGYDSVPAALSQDRTRELIEKKKAFSFAQPLDALYIPASAQATGNAIVFALNTSYQDFHPRNYEHYLRNGADVVLWNPSELNGKQFSTDLTSVLKAMLARNPQQKIAIKTHCASLDPAIAAASQLNTSHISLIADRGYGDVQKLARSFTVLSSLSWVSTILRDTFSCNGITKISALPGSVLFLAPSPQDDQLLHLGGGNNLTYELFAKRTHDTLIELKDSDHWTRWSHETHNKVNTFLSRQGILSSSFTPATAQEFPPQPVPSFFSRNILPLISKAWC